MRNIALIIILFILCPFAKAQINHPNSKERQALEQKNYFWATKEVDSLVVKALAENLPQFFNTPGLPQFTVIGKERKYYLGIGGYVKTIVSYDFGSPIDNATSFVPALIPMDPKKGNKEMLQFSAGASKLNFNFIALPHTKNKIGIYFSFDFNNPNYNFSLSNAYAKYKGFTIGFGNSLYTDAMASPTTIDCAGPNSFTTLSNTILDYEYIWGKNWGVGIGLEMPMISYTTDKESYSVNQKLPDIPFYLQYSWNKRSSWIRLSGLLRNLYYYDEASDKTARNLGYGIKMSGSIVMFRKLTSFYQGVFGKGISTYIQDMNNMGMDMLPSKESPGKLNNVTSWAGYGGLQYNFTMSTFISAAYSVVYTSASSSIYQPDQFKGSQYLVFNFFQNIASQVQIGFEYLWGSWKNADSQKQHDSRFSAMLQFNF